jgi:nucleoside-diphosphate-sugar epimerase
MRVLVTGSEGFIGKNITKYLEEKGYKVIKVDLNGGEVVGDITSEQFVFQELAKIDFDSVVHLAAITNIKYGIENSYSCFKVNSFGTLNILELSYRKKVKRFIYSSSSNVYGLPKELPVKETTQLNPRVPYDYSKVASEAMVFAYYKAKNLPIVIFRPWKQFGPYDKPDSAIMRFIKASLKDEPITLYNAGADVTDPCYIENYCWLIEASLREEKAVGEVFNVGTGIKKSIREIAEEIKRLTSSSSKLHLLPPRTKHESEAMISYPSIEKAKKMLGYRPIVGFEEGLIKTIKWVKNNLC